GYLPKSGEPPLKHVRRTEIHVQLKQGIFGVKVRILPPGIKFPDKVTIHEPEAEDDTESTPEVEEAEADTSVSEEEKAAAE
ncbi:MAG: 30S ribosomal protein S3, partial [Candidatus Bathyarchaeota archaeon]|nr:30S ribosomal protein S3 [Candidatus Bathyarchaeota archaeon]